MPGAVGIVADADGTRHLGAHGTRGAGMPMAADTIFRIASLTKAVVAIAVLACVERGELDLDTPVRDIIAAFDNVMVLEGFDGDRPRLRLPRRQATVRHLLTDTSGLTYDAFSADLLRYGELSGVPMPSSGLRACFATPLLFDPGERFAYGMSTDWTGQVLEALTGVPLADHLRATVAEPLGLRDLAFTLGPDQRRRLAGVSCVSPTGPSRRSSSNGRTIRSSIPPDTASTPRRLTTSGCSGCSCVAASSTASACSHPRRSQ